MRQVIETFHRLEMRDTNRDSVWHKPFEGMYHHAELLAYFGKLPEAIEEAEKTRLREYGEMHGIEFRCVTKMTTITKNCGTVSSEDLAY